MSVSALCFVLKIHLRSFSESPYRASEPKEPSSTS